MEVRFERVDEADGVCGSAMSACAGELHSYSGAMGAR